MSDQAWELLPGVGIEKGAIRIVFGMARQELRSLLAGLFPPPAQRKFADGDDFVSADATTFIRIGYEGDRVRDIVFLGGSLRYRGIDLHAGTDFGQIEERLGELGMSFRPSQWMADGQDCVELGASIATRDDVGGDGDGIEWVSLSSDFR